MAKSNSEFKSIQKKLVAAVAMVLVASIMVVSSSYAWFTLSTAPEVTGIQTAVGSNGNLEIALRTGLPTAIETGVGKDFPDANNYWGNLLDLSDDSYHFDELALRPSRLNATLNTTGKWVQKTQDNVPVWSNGTVTAAASYTPDGYTMVQKADANGKVWLKDGKEVVAETQPEGATPVQATKNSVPVWVVGTEEYAADPALKKNVEDVEAKQYTTYKFADGGYLRTPIYGADGRVSSLAANTVNGIYNDGAFKNVEDTFGVRAVGVTSSITPEALRLRNAKMAVNSAISGSKTSASISLRDDSVKLADIIIAHVLNKDHTYGASDVQNIKDAITNLQNIKTELENALKQAVVAVGVYQGKTFEPENVTVSGTEITVKVGDKVIELDWDGREEVKDGDKVTVTALADLTQQKTDLMAAAGKLVTLQGLLTGSKTAVDGLTASTGITWKQIQGPLTNLLSTEHFDIIDSTSGEKYTVAEFQTLADTETLKAVRIILGTPTISIKGGAYYNVAEFSGNYSATTSMTVTGTYGGVSLNNETITVVMATAAESTNTANLPNGFHLPYITNWMGGLTISGGTAAPLITDIYGYAVDLAFRTNAAGSSLLLQTEAANRVDDSTATQGGGSYMEFKSGHADFSLKQVAELMSSIRVVFMDDAGVIYGVAVMDVELQKIDTTPEDKTDESWKIATADSVFTESVDHDNDPSTPELVYEMELIGGTLTQNNTAIKAPLVLANFSVGSDGIMTINGTKADPVITALPQNTPVAISALVYLDGDRVDNSDVAISGNSMTGTMNLQFASDAELDPMDYTYPQLEKPTASLSGDTLTITKGDDNATAYDIYDGNVKVATVQANADKTVDTINLSTLITNEGTHSITVVATARNYASSEATDALTYTVVAPPTDETTESSEAGGSA